MKKEVQLFFTALLFYTRIPIPKSVEYLEENAKQSFKYLPAVGVLVGACMAIVLLFSCYVLPSTVAVILSITCGIFITGAFHEDGLADTADGFGGGWKKETILKIMKDSSIGTYGTIALLLSFLLRYEFIIALLNIPVKNGISSANFISIALIVAQSVSRLMAVTTLVTHKYVRMNDPSSKSRSNAEVSLRWTSVPMIVATLFGVLPLVFLRTPLVVVLLMVLYGVKFLMMRFFYKWIGGYTGDCLGAIQQITELTFYLGLILLWKFI